MPTSPAIRDYGSRQLLRFLLLTGGMYLLWFFSYEQWLALDGHLDLALCANIAQTSVRLLRTIGFDAAVAPTNAYLLLMNGHPSVIVGIPCNGLVLYALFGGFVLAFPGPWRRKLWFIPAGMVLIWTLNILRVAALAINHSYAYRSVYFNHHYTYTFVVYGFIFGLWMLWAKRLAVYDSQHSAPSTTFVGA